MDSLRAAVIQKTERTSALLHSTCGSKSTKVFCDPAMSSDQKDGPVAITPDACWRVLENVATSPQLKRAARLREFLRYVGTRAIKEDCIDIHEQEIGQTVFGRGDAYDTSQDNIVRVSATELRKRVDAYFAAEGKDEPIIFEIPRGSYMPIFRLRAADSKDAGSVRKPDTAKVTNPLTAAAPSRGVWLLLFFVSAVALLLAIACIVLWLQNQSLRKTLGHSNGQATLSAPSPRCPASPSDAEMTFLERFHSTATGICRYAKSGGETSDAWAE